MARYFCNVTSLISNALHIGYHMECRTYGTQISCNRLLLKQKLHTKCLNVPLLGVSFTLALHCKFSHFLCSCKKRLRCIRKTVLAFCT